MADKKTMTRRDFLRASTIAGGVLALEGTVLGGTVEGVSRAVASSRLFTPPTRVRPVVVRRGPKTVAIVQQFPYPPLAYFDKEAREIYVDLEYRDKIIEVLNAEVSRGIWTFDSTDQSAKEEAKEAKYQEWDKMKAPQIGDCRIINRSYENVRWEFNCVPIYDSHPHMWWNGEPIEHGQRVGREIEPGREDYMLVGTCHEYSDPDCTRFVRRSNVLNWIACDEFSRKLPEDIVV